jgi:flagellar hook-associated protein 3 FlgL
MIATVSSFGMAAQTQLQVNQLQKQLTTAQNELSSGRVTDAGVDLGGNEYQSVVLRQAIDQINSFTSSNAVVSTALDATQGALTSVAANGSAFSNALLSAQSSGGDPALLQQNALNSLSSFTGLMNTTSTEGYLFAGQNSSAPPLSAFDQTPPSAAQTALDAAFQSAFGVAIGSPGASAITPAQMQQFLGNQFAALFGDPAWASTWSSAEDQTASNRISGSQSVNSSVSANDPAFRQMASAMTMVAGLGLGSLNASTQQAVIAAATQAMQAGLQGVTSVKATVGMAQQNLSQANTTNSQQLSFLNSQVSDLESVDPTQLSVQINDLKTQLETTYSLTAQLQNLSLVKYL